MNQLQKHFSASLIALVALFSASSIAMAAPASSLSNFAILSASASSVTGAVTLSTSTINGDVGSSGSVTLTGSTVNGNVIDTTAFTNTGSTVSGTTTSPLSASVVTDFNTALAAGLATQCTDTSTLLPAYTGQTLVLAPGVYCINTASGLTFTNTTLVLKGSAKASWTFIISGAAGLTGTDFNVVLANGQPVPCDAITWYVAQGATITANAGTPSFVGTIYAGAAISMTGTSTALPLSFNGDALAGAAVTTTDATVTACTTTVKGGHNGQLKDKCNQGVGNGYEGCDPGNSNNTNTSNDELVTGEYGTPGDPGRQPDNTATPF